jgi:hypothetical protein
MSDDQRGPQKPGIQAAEAQAEGASDLATESDLGTQPDLETAPDEGAASDLELPRGGVSRSVISQKELARQYRRQAYQRAKAYRAADPKYAQMKEKAKLRKRELYQEIKNRRKLVAAADKVTRAAQQSEERAAAKRERRQGLMGALRREGAAAAEEGPARQRAFRSREDEPATHALQGGAEPDTDESPLVDVQSEVANALKNKRLSELVRRVRLAGEEPNVIANEACSSGTVVPLSRSRRAKEGSPG